MKFAKRKDYLDWIDSQECYQTMTLPSKIKIKGKFNTDKRISYLEKLNFNNKNILDIGCNSGQYCIFAKQNNANQVYGIDLNKIRIEQAKILATNESLEINFLNEDINKFNFPNNINIDYIFCFAVITEISDIFSVLNFLKKHTHNIALIEMKLSEPLFYFSKNLKYYFNYFKKKTYTAEIYKHMHAGWVFHPSLKFIKHFFGKNFEIKYINKGMRYDFISIKKLS